jgi:hypothetical protein
MKLLTSRGRFATARQAIKLNMANLERLTRVASRLPGVRVSAK